MSKYAVKFNGKSLNADRSTTLKAWDRSEINILRVVVNEMIHAVDTGDYRGLRAIVSHVVGRKAVFATIKSVIKAATGKTFSITINDDGDLAMTIAAQEKRAFVHAIMGKLVIYRDEAKVGLFNTEMLQSIGVGVAKEPEAFDLAKAATSIVKRATKANLSADAVIAAIREAFAAQVVEEDDEVTAPPAFAGGGEVVGIMAG
jgi:hypothetical protein